MFYWNYTVKIWLFVYYYLLLRIIIFIVTICLLYKKKKKSNLVVSKILPVNIFYIYYIIADKGTPHLDASLERFRKQHFVRSAIFRNAFLIIVVKQNCLKRNKKYIKYFI